MNVGVGISRAYDEQKESMILYQKGGRMIDVLLPFYSIIFFLFLGKNGDRRSSCIDFVLTLFNFRSCHENIHELGRSWAWDQKGEGAEREEGYGVKSQWSLLFNRKRDKLERETQAHFSSGTVSMALAITYHYRGSQRITE